jgi:phosphoribosyl-AMP cyclohydrolase
MQNLKSTKAEIELGNKLMPKFDENGLVAAIAQCAKTKDVLMIAYMNKEALDKTIETGLVHYWSRSRAELWLKGETSGQLQRLIELRVDCDQDAVLLLVEVGGDGGCCHVGFENCFYRSLSESNLEITGKKPLEPNCD